MPSPISIQSLPLISIIFCLILLTIAFHLQARAVQQSEGGSAPEIPPDERVFAAQSSLNQNATLHPSITLLPPLIILIIGRLFTRTTYYDYFIYSTLLWPLFAISTTALLAASLTSRAFIKSVTSWEAQALIQLMLAALTIALGWATITILPHKLTNDIRALSSGPQHATGKIDATDMLGGRESIASIVVDGIHYSTYDFAWWRSLHRDQTIQFVHDPAQTMAFASTRIAITPAGAVVGSCIATIWLWIGGFVVWRFLHPITARR